MATEITQRQLRNDSGDIMRRLDSGEVFVLIRNGVPVGELTPLRHNQWVSREVVAQAFSGVEPVDYQSLRADLDAVVDQSTELRP